jgi:hypothetical protein
MKIVFTFGSLFLCAIIQISFISNLPAPYLFINIAAAALFIAALYSGALGASGALFLTGILWSYSSKPLWELSLAWIVIPLVVALSKKFIFLPHIQKYTSAVSVFLFIIPLSFFVNLANSVILSLRAFDVRAVLLQAVFSIALLLFAYPLINKALLRHG